MDEHAIWQGRHAHDTARGTDERIALGRPVLQMSRDRVPADVIKAAFYVEAAKLGISPFEACGVGRWISAEIRAVLAEADKPSPIWEMLDPASVPNAA